MTEQGDSGEKKHKPTRWRLQKAREQGEVAKSKDLTSAVVLTCWVAAFALGGPILIKTWERHAIEMIAESARPTAEPLVHAVWSWSILTLVGVSALLTPVAVVGLLAQFAQVGPVFAPNQVSLDFSRLNPTTWAKRLVKWETAVELLKSIAKQGMVVVIGYAVFKSQLALILGLAEGQPAAVLPALAKVLLALFGVAAALGLSLGGLDLLYQRFVFLRKMRMSTTEFRRHWKELTGDPKIKNQRKRLYREWANHSAAEATRGATVVVTNPTHYAVALAYDPAEHAAPVVAAKGQDDLAAEIRRAAEDAAVPIIRNPSLARELHDRVDIEETVPEDLFVVVAEVIVWASRLREVGPLSPP